MRPDLRYLRRRRGRTDRIAALEIELGLAEPLMLWPIPGYHPKLGQACTVVPELGLILPAGAQLHALANAGSTAAQAAVALDRSFDLLARERMRRRPRIGLYMTMLACPLSSGAFLLPVLLAHLHV